MALPTYDESRWPVLLLTMPAAGMSAQDCEGHLERMGTYYERGVPFALVIDTRNAPQMDARQRARIAAHIKHKCELHPGILRGAAIVTASAAQRAVITAINWVARAPYPMEPFSSIVSAVEWAKERAAAPDAATAKASSSG